jgi:hypothetical protein
MEGLVPQPFQPTKGGVVVGRERLKTFAPQVVGQRDEVNGKGKNSNDPKARVKK